MCYNRINKMGRDENVSMEIFAEFVGVLNVIYLMYWSIEMSENLHKNSILY